MGGAQMGTIEPPKCGGRGNIAKVGGAWAAAEARGIRQDLPKTTSDRGYEVIPPSTTIAWAVRNPASSLVT